MPCEKAGKIIECMNLKHAKAREFQKIQAQGWLKKNLEEIKPTL